jgi:hypothetical protein
MARAARRCPLWNAGGHGHAACKADIVHHVELFIQRLGSSFIEEILSFTIAVVASVATVMEAWVRHNLVTETV